MSTVTVTLTTGETVILRDAFIAGNGIAGTVDGGETHRIPDSYIESSLEHATDCPMSWDAYDTCECKD